MKVIAVLLLCSSLIVSTSAFNVLVTIPGTIRSLHALLSEIVLALADAGHNITFVTSFPLSREHDRVDLRQTFLLSERNTFDLRSTENLTKIVKQMQDEYIEKTWSDKEINDLWSKRNDFDLILISSLFNEFLFPFLIDFNGIFVQVCTPGIEGLSLSRDGNWLPPSVVPEINKDYDDEMSFIQRFLNFNAVIDQHASYKRLIKEKQDALQKIFPQLEPLENYYDRVALTLINGHFALDGPVPLLPSQVEIGTITAKKPKPLPKDLAEFMDGSGDAGVIYFSLGSIARSSDIPIDAKKALVEAFRRIPQRVVWKYEGDVADLPPNVMTKNWLPQQDVLGHPKTRVFISHCGNIGTQEAKYHGVPVLGMPIAFDQPRNGARMERKGLAIVLKWEEITTERVIESLDKLINDPSYKDRLQTLSRVLQDQKDTPAERAVWWLEYVVRHKGAPHLEYAGKRLSLFQYLLLDVILFWCCVWFVFLLLIVLGIRAVCCRRKKTQVDKTKKKRA